MSFGTEETVLVTHTFRSRIHLVLLDCVLPPRQAAYLQSGVGPSYVSLVAEDAAQPGQWEPLMKAAIHSHKHKLAPGSVALCSSNLRSGLQPYVLEWVNWHLMLGVDHIIIYLADMSPAIPEVLRPYVESGNVELRLWQLPELWAHALMSQQASLINDCLYRGTDRFAWMMSVDLDEYLFPGRPSSLKSILEQQSKEEDVGSLLVKSWSYVPKLSPWEAGGTGATGAAPWGKVKMASNGTSLGEDLELLSIKHFDHRAAGPEPFGHRTKAIWRTANVESVETHLITHGGRTVEVDESTMHWKHLYVLNQNRPSEGHDVHDPSAFERFGQDFIARWPYGFTQQF